jgi:hypothetical protein
VKCPHCIVEFHDQPAPIYIGEDVDGLWAVVMRVCPACKRLSLTLQNGSQFVAALQQGRHQAPGFFPGLTGVFKEVLVRPKGSNRPPCPVEVPKNFADDYAEACLVLPDSAKAAAALGRRCLQNLLRDHVKVKHGSLADEIQEVIDSGKLPADLTDSIDAIRNIGNFAAHPMKSKQSGEILEVLPGEAEWIIVVLEELFDFYFVRPAQRQKLKDELNKKLQEAGKPPMK